MENSEMIKNRINNMRRTINKASAAFDKLPVPDNVKNKIKTLVFGDEKLNELLSTADGARIPRVLFMGRTGVGKSTLINAICGAYLACVSNAKSCTEGSSRYTITDSNGNPLMDIYDTRGIAESIAINNENSEKQLKNDIERFHPDIMLLVEDATVRDAAIDGDIRFVKDVRHDYNRRYNQDLPLVMVINKCDSVPPTSEQGAENYSPMKREAIEKIVKEYQSNFTQKGLIVEKVIGVSSNIEWANGDTKVSNDVINSASDRERKSLQIGFDGRYNIDVLRDAIEDGISDIGAKRGFRMSFELNDVVERISKELIVVFSGIAGTIAFTPIPTSDIYILLALQTFMVLLIASLSGREITFDTAKEFLLSLGGVGAGGIGLRTIAQQSSKLLNFLVPFTGSAVSAAIASTGTMAMGHMVIEYYIKGKDIKTVKKSFEKLKKQFKKDGRKKNM